MVTLDLYLAYLRNAYHTCYYCAIVTDHLEEFQRKCISHVRRPLTYAMRMDLEREEQKKREKEEKQPTLLQFFKEPVKIVAESGT